MAALPPSRFGPNVPRFLDCIAFAEGTSTSPVTQKSGYDVIVSSIHGPATFDDFSDHPFAPQFHRAPQVLNHNGLESTAAGRYQLLYRYWVSYKTLLRLRDFHPDSQDLVAIQQIKEKGGLPFVLRGDWESAVKACCGIWASLPGSPYGQAGGKTLAELGEQWESLASGENGENG